MRYTGPAPVGALITIDPSLRSTGIAYWSATGTLLWATALPTRSGRGPGVWSAIAAALPDRAALTEYVQASTYTVGVEVPVHYGPGGADPHDISELCGVAGAIVGRLAPDGVIALAPAEWKGQVPKAVCCNRIAAIVDAMGWSGSVDPTHKNKSDPLDAIGIGLYIQNITKRGGIRAPAL
jgi:hypothetical protein